MVQVHHAQILAPINAKVWKKSLSLFSFLGRVSCAIGSRTCPLCSKTKHRTHNLLKVKGCLKISEVILQIGSRRKRPPTIAVQISDNCTIMIDNAMEAKAELPARVQRGQRETMPLAEFMPPITCQQSCQQEAH